MDSLFHCQLCLFLHRADCVTLDKEVTHFKVPDLILLFT